MSQIKGMSAIVTCESCGVEARRPADWQATQLLEDALPSDQPEGWAKLTLVWEICPRCVEEGEGKLKIEPT